MPLALSSMKGRNYLLNRNALSLGTETHRDKRGRK